MSIKIERIGSQMTKEISYILAEEVKDQDLKFVTITDCKVTNDLSYAKVYFTTVDNREKVCHDLNQASGYFRSLLASRLNIRHTPELKFIFDESIEYGQKIEKIIEKLHNEK